MQSENFDKKIKDSLSQRPPGNDNPDWDKMETLLDKHLPVEKKDRRRFFIVFLFLFLLTGGGALLIWQNSDGDKNSITGNGPKNNNSEAPGVNNPTTQNNKPVTDPGNAGKKDNDLSDQINSVTNKSIVPNSIISSNDDPTAPEFLITNPLTSKKEPKQRNDIPLTDNLIVAEKVNNDPVKNTEPDKKQTGIENVINPVTDPVSAEKNNQPQKTAADNKIDGQKTAPNESQPIAQKKTDPQKQNDKRSFFNNLFFTASAGPDFSTVGFDKPGKLEMNYGTGIGYTISNKLSLRTGFYAARKIYTADPDEYYMPYNIALYYPNLRNIDANCKVYEIPLMLDYTLSSNQKGSWFVSGGVSSLIMKEETYDYYYKPNSSPTYLKYTRTIDNENKHYFSQINLSGGYTMNINKNISLRGEPYIKIATHGVGLGKVKLNSGGVLFSAIIKPFARK